MGQDLFQGSPRSRLDRIASALRAVHKALIEATQRDYERTHGKIQNPYALFSLVTQDPAFAWLQPMTALIVEIEDGVGRKEPPVGPADLSEARAKIERLLVSEGGAFSKRYLSWVQQSPEVAVEHGRLQGILRDPASGP